MSKLPPVRSKDLLKVLKKAGFQVARQAGSHVRLIHPDGRATSVSVHNKSIPVGTLRSIIRDIKLSKQQFLDLL